MVWPPGDGVVAAHAGGERGETGRLDPEDADVGLDGLGRGGHPGDQAAAADRHRQDLQVRRVLQHLQRDGALAGHDVQVVERMDEHQVPLARTARRAWS